MPQNPDPMKDHDMLTRIDANVEMIKAAFEKLEGRVGAVEKKVWYGAGIMVAGVFILEMIFKK
jgi:hypothetical protein